MKVPPEPIMFMKATSAVIGPNDDVIIPKNSFKSDWEVELGIVIGKETKYISEEQSPDSIAGYCIVNDLSERAFQIERSGQWVKGKQHTRRSFVNQEVMYGANSPAMFSL